LGGTKAAMAFTDPPYNVGLGDHGGQGRDARRRRIANDALDPAAWEAFSAAWAGVLVGAVDGALYVCMSSKEWPTVARALEAAGGHWSDTLIWWKDRFTLGRSDFQRQYEPIWYGWPEGSDHWFAGDRAQSDVWSIPRPAISNLHPAMKPLALIERALDLGSRLGERVLDPFAGSGSTLIACERTGRLAAVLELDPTYADVILARWEAFTGGQASRVA
jgi:DNA modification methylase